MQTFPDLTSDQIADEITTWAGQLAAGEAKQLDYIAEFDRREAWGGPGLLSCAHWLSWKTGLGPVAARERVRGAWVLADLPSTDEAFHAGRLSWSQVRDITRVATAENEMTYDADGNLVITIKAPAEDGAVIMAAVEQVRADLDRQRQQAAPDGRFRGIAPGGPPASMTEAFVEMSRRLLEQLAKDHPATARRHRSNLTALLDPLSGWGRLRDGELLPLSPLKKVSRSLPGRGVPRLRPVGVADLRLEDLGRSRREASLALRELLGTVDGERCRFPGCTRHRKLHGHHVVYWSDGGTTNLANLILLCSRHHTLVHQLGFQLLLAPDRRLTVATPEGVPVLHHPAPPWGDPAALDPIGEVDATTVTPDTVQTRVDLAYVVSVVMQQAA